MIIKQSITPNVQPTATRDDLIDIWKSNIANGVTVHYHDGLCEEIAILIDGVDGFQMLTIYNEGRSTEYDAPFFHTNDDNGDHYFDLAELASKLHDENWSICNVAIEMRNL